MNKVKSALDKATKIVKLNAELESVSEIIEGFKKSKGSRNYNIIGIESNYDNRWDLWRALDENLLESMTQYMVTKLRKKRVRIEIELEKLSK